MSDGILVAGIGNLFCRDDGFGPEVARRLAGQPLPAGVRVVDYGIRGMHLAYDLLDGYRALVIVDALPGEGEPGDLRVLRVGTDDLGEGGFDPHGMDPVSVLASLGTLGGELPYTLVVGCLAGAVDEGIGLTPPVAAAVDEAVVTVRRLVDELVANRVEA